MRTWLAATLLSLSTALGPAWGAVPPGETESAPVSPQSPYDADLYELGYQVFLANNNPRDAFLLAEKAVAARPDDSGWRRRAAQSGEWSGQPARALEHWYHLARSGEETAQHALELARGLAHYSYLKELLELGELSGERLREYVQACDALGVPEEALARLQQPGQEGDRRYRLEQQARLYEAVGRPHDSISAHLQLASAYGATAEGLLKAAALAYGTGDPQSAYTILNLGRRRFSEQERDYWQTFGDLAWALQDLAGSEQAARQLMKSGGAKNEEFRRLILLTRERQPEEAFSLAMEAWRRFHQADYLRTVLELGLSLKHQDQLAPLLEETERSGTLAPQERDAYFWTLVSRVHRARGAVGASLAAYRRALAHSPDDGEMAAGFIWLLLDLDRRGELQDQLAAWQGREQGLPALLEPFGAAHAYLGQYRPALRFFQAAYGRKRGDAAWLAAYADLLEQSGRPEAAFRERLQAMELTHARLRRPGSVQDQLLKQELARVAMLLTPGDSLNALMRDLLGGQLDASGRELAAAWTLSNQSSDLAHLWFWRGYVRLIRRPAWVEQSLALEQNDRPALAGLLETDLERLPYRDAVEGAQRVGWQPLAESHAFRRFQENDDDYLLDLQIRDLFGNRGHGLGYRFSLMEQNGIGFLEQQASLAAAVNRRLTLQLQLESTEIRHQRQGVLGSYPSSSQAARLGFSLRHEQGTAHLSAGVADGLARHAVAGFRGNWRMGARSSLELALAAGAVAPESVALRVGGMKDEVSLGLQQALTLRDSFSLRLSARTLRDQEWRPLGQGGSLEGELNHRLLAGWPDTVLRLYGGYHRYRTSGTPTGRALLLIPAGLRGTADASFYVPASFGQTGVGITVGQEGRDTYIRHWRPFAILDANWNSSSGAGFRYELGLAGPLLGLDKLEGAVSQESGAFGSSDITSRFDLHYRYFFE